ncbi:DUF2637 domain-containing protein [Streptomyces sp. 4.24]|uniref:DUF2637 domain-containing protein n=1 Tax=Streptomyces tritrimontium TaxID=3406573 RepID=UPI003BB5EFC6
MQLTRTHRILIGVVVAGAVVIAAIGFAGSYSAVRALALQKGFGSFSLVFPIGIDAGICVLLALDLLLTWIRIPFPLLRQTAWLLTIATIAFNGAAAWPDPLGVGMHAVIPILFVVTVEAARHAVGRIADITADRHMEGVRITRWLLSPIPTFKLWRRMKLWELRSYEQAVGMEQDRLIYQARLQARYGRFWRRKAPVGALMPLRLARIGVPLSQTAPEGLAAAGIDPLLLPPAPAEVFAPAPAPALPVSVPDCDTVAEQLANPTGDSPGEEARRGDILPTSAPALVDWHDAAAEFIEQYGQLATAEQLAAFLAQRYGVTDPQTSGLLADHELLEPVLADLRAAGLEPDSRPASGADQNLSEATAEPDKMPVLTANEISLPSSQPHPFFGEPRREGNASSAPMEPVLTLPASMPVPTAAAREYASMRGPSEQKQSVDTLLTLAADEQPWVAEVTDTGEATARVPQQQSDEIDVTPVQKEIELVAQWLAEAEDAGKRLSGAETARRLGVSAKTGQRRVLEASRHLEDIRQRQGRAHLRSVRN